MSASILDPSDPRRERNATWGPPTEDLESTTDVHEESTSDLAPATQDVTRDEPARDEPVDVAIPLTPAPPVATSAPVEPPSPVTPAPRAAAPAARVENAPAERQAAPKAPRPVAPGPGTVLCDRYLIEQMIGRGGTAVVFSARDMLSSTGSEPNRQVAIKAPRPDLADRGRAVARLRHEFEHATRLSHPNIVRVMEFRDDATHCFIAMELIEGRLLSSLIRDWTMLAPPLTRRILRDCAQALSYAHRHGVVHGDFKPGNVFVTADEQVKVLDFGASAFVLEPDESRIAAGTPAYASPEVLGGATPEPRDDVFSFACVAYELLTGQHPYERRSSLVARSEALVPQRAWSLSSNQWLALLSAMSWERAQRPANIETLMAALTAEPPEPAPATQLPAELMPRSSSWGFFVFLACAVAVIVITMQRPRQTASAVTPNTNAPAAPATQAPGTTPAPAESTQRAPPATDLRTTGETTVPAGRSPSSSTGGAGAALAGKAATAPSASAAATQAAPARAVPASTRPAAAPVSQLSFESSSIVTSESAVAAVFVVKRSPPLTGRVRVQWSAESGTARAGVDFAANAHGAVEFADGQSQRAIYVPLRNDLKKEGDETFSVRLHSPQGAKLGPIARAEAIIRDDD